MNNIIIIKNTNTKRLRYNARKRIVYAPASEDLKNKTRLEIISLAKFGVEDTEKTILKIENTDYNIKKIKDDIIKLKDKLLIEMQELSYLIDFDIGQFKHKKLICKPIVYKGDYNIVIKTKKPVIIGNNIEGYIKYDRIFMLFDYKFRIKDVVFKFKRSYFSHLHILHPHIVDDNICYGNREDDALMFIRNMLLEDYAQILWETISNYSPHSP